MTGCVDEGKLMGVVCFDLTKDFDTVSQSSFIARLVRYRLDNWEVRLVENWLAGPSGLKCGDQQYDCLTLGSTPEPKLFVLY